MVHTNNKDDMATKENNTFKSTERATGESKQIVQDKPSKASNRDEKHITE